MSRVKTGSDLADFVIIGAMKSGTSTLQVQLAAQPGLFMSSPKEPNFFSDDDVFAKGMGWYQGLFSAAAEGELKGEASTHYTKLPTYPQTVARMQAALAAPKLIYVIRNPVQRAVSHYLHEVTMRVMEGDAEVMFATHPELVAYGQYAMQIAPFIEVFGKDSIHLTSLEQLKAEPDAEFARIGAFLGRPGLVWDHAQKAQNVSAERIKRFPLHGLIFDNPVAGVLRRTLVPRSLRDKIKARRQITDRPTLPEPLLRKLEAEFASDHAKLSALFPGHPALRLCYPFL